MNLWQQYVLPTSISEALQALRTAAGPAYAIAGGTDLLLDLEQGRHSPAHTLVDLTSVAEMTVIEPRAGRLFIGASASLTRVARHPLVARHAQALVEACDLVGGPQVRNVATLGGNVAHALPAADGTIALVALDAVVEIAALQTNRRIPLEEFFRGPGKSVLKSGEELILGFHVPLSSPVQASCFKRIMRPQGVALPIINVAIWLERERDAATKLRIAVGPGGPTPWRARDAEQVLTGKTLTDETATAALEALLAHVGFRSSPRRGSADYRRHLMASLFRETLAMAWERAALKGEMHESA
jgi:carbon-monoxide dehydrogenase medium subunit